MPKRRLMGEINVVPYIDVMLVLLIIFMVTAPLLTQGIEVELPKANAAPLDTPVDEQVIPIVLSLDADGALYINVGEQKSSPVTADEVVDHVRVVLGRRPDTPVLVKSDQSLPIGDVVKAMALLQAGGAESVGILTDPSPESPGE